MFQKRSRKSRRGGRGKRGERGRGGERDGRGGGGEGVFMFKAVGARVFGGREGEAGGTEASKTIFANLGVCGLCMRRGGEDSERGGEKERRNGKKRKEKKRKEKIRKEKKRKIPDSNSENTMKMFHFVYNFHFLNQ